MSKLLFTVIFLLMPWSVLAKPQTILVFGDSISAGYGIDVTQGWVSLLQKKLVESNSQYSIINASISGETSAGG